MKSVLKYIFYTVTILVAGAIIFVLAYFFRDADNDNSVIFEIASEEEKVETLPVCDHVFASETGNTCQICGYVFEPVITPFIATMHSVKNKCAVRTFYYQGDNIVEYLSEGEAVEVTGSLTNALKSEWYITSDGYYIFADNLN